MPHENTPAESQLTSALAAMAPGTELRAGLERILRGQTGALIVVGAVAEIEPLCSGGIALDAEFSATILRELAKMDGAVVIDPGRGRIVRAAVQLMPDAAIPTSESGTRHRTAERIARQTGLPVISVSKSMHTITLYLTGLRHRIGETHEITAKAQQALTTLDRYRERLNEVSSSLTALEIEDLVTTRDVAQVAVRQEMVGRIASEIDAYVLELGTEGRLLQMQVDEMRGGTAAERESLLRDYLPDEAIGPALDALHHLAGTDLLDLDHVIDTIGLPHEHNAETSISPRGYRLLGQIPHLPGHVIERLIAHFQSFQAILAASAEDLTAVDGVGKQRALAVRTGLSRIAEMTMLES